MSFFNWIDDPDVVAHANHQYYLELQDELARAKAIEKKARDNANNLVWLMREAELNYAKSTQKVREVEQEIRRLK